MRPVALYSQVPAEFEVPNGLMNVDGNDASRLPFAYLGPVRYQQVYDASQFSSIPPGGAWLTRIYLRADCTSVRSWEVTNLQVNVSTTPKGPDNLSPVFDDNIGNDETIIFGPARYIPPASGCLVFSELIANHQYNFPFYYAPSKGNLLIDFRNFGINWTGGFLDESKLDAQNVFGDSVSRVAAFSLSTNTAEVVDTIGRVTLFRFDPTPSLTASFQTNTLTVTFPLLPAAFVLQWADKVGPGPLWTNYPGPIDQIGFFRFATIPAGSLQAPKFFRLFLQTPQPLSPQARGAETTKRVLQTR